MAGWKQRNGKGREEDNLDNENQRLTEQLSGKVSRLKNLAFDIKTDTEDHNVFLSDMDTDFDSSKGLLGGSVNRLSHMVSSGKNNRKAMCYLILGLVGLFILIYYIARRFF